MKQYTFYIREYLISDTFTVEAETEQEATEKAEQMFMDGTECEDGYVIETRYTDGWEAVLTGPGVEQ